MTLKMKKFEKMVRGSPEAEKESFENETINEIRLIELERHKQSVFVNALNHIEDDKIKVKCIDITTHYRLFKDDETHYIAPELSKNEKDKLKRYINECMLKECNRIIDEKECIPRDLLKMIESKPDMSNTLQLKLNIMLSFLNKYFNNKKDINNSLFKLLDSSYVNILEAQKLSKQIDNFKANAHMLQSDIVNTFSCSEKLYKLLEKYYNSKEKEYELNLKTLEDLRELQNKYKQIDGVQYRDIVKKFLQIQTIIKSKTELFQTLNS